MEKNVLIDGKKIELGAERNVLEVCRKAGIDIPTFCYHSELSVYGACRMCLVDIQGRGIVTSCSTAPEAGMVIATNTKQIREIRRINLELLLANHDRECTTCLKSGACSLQDLSRKMGVDTIRFKPTHTPREIDYSSPSITRDPNKCVLCGDCVRICEEIQSVGAIDFAYRGANSQVLPALGRKIADVECVDCGQCSRVCPTGALTPRSHIKETWALLDDPQKTVVVQVAPAIRVALGEHFGMPPGTITTGKVAAALRRLGFDKVYDTSFTADLTVFEEGKEFFDRLGEKRTPLFTSCCPAWVKFAEQYYPELLPSVSTCKSPQQMFGALARHLLPAMLTVEPANLAVVSIMPCTAKKFEATRPEFKVDGLADVDLVLTSQELGRMIECAGIRFTELDDEPFDTPFGAASGAGVIFGASGGVTEAVVRFAARAKGEAPTITQTERGRGIRELTVDLGGTVIRAAVVFGLANARKVCKDVRRGTCAYDFVEVMACPGGCINGAGQPVTYDPQVIARRGRSLYDADRSNEWHTAQENTAIVQTYKEFLGEIGGETAHHLLHTSYKPRKRCREEVLDLSTGAAPALTVEVCVGTSCCLNGAHALLKEVVHYVDKKQLRNVVDVKAAFCFEQCGKQSPSVRIGETIVGKCTFERIRSAIDQAAGPHEVA
jgi:NADH-quinone oxidoreductase subunit G